MRLSRTISAVFWAALFWAALPNPCPAAQWTVLQDIVQTFAINGKETRVVLHPRLRTTPQGGRQKADLMIRGDLEDLKRITSSLTLWRQPLEVFNTALVLKGHDLRPDPPGVLAEGLLSLEGTEESALLRARLVPEIVGNAVRLRALPAGEVGEGSIKTALRALGLDELNPLLLLLNRFFGAPEALLEFPPEFEAYHPVFRSVSFGDPGGGGLSLLVEAGFELAPGERDGLIRALAGLGD